MGTIDRRRFLALGLTSAAAAMALGSTQAGRVAGLVGGSARAATRAIRLEFGEAEVEMVDLSKVYMWTFEDEFGPNFPGPTIHAVEGDVIGLTIRNRLRQPHAFAVAGTGISTGSIPPGEEREFTMTAPAAGTYIYLDPLNAPLNRLMGLHGVMVVLPQAGPSPYTDPPPAVRRLFEDLGSTAHFPGEPWIPERTRVWHLHTVDPRWNARVAAGESVSGAQVASDHLARYFLIGGRSGYFASHAPDLAPSGRIGQPHLIRIVNTGMVRHSLHIHGNHVAVTCENGRVSTNAPFIDSWPVGPMQRVDWLLPFVRPPDIPGLESLPLRTALRQELAYRDKYGLFQSPIEYPMHCHMEPSQTAAGGNYPGGTVTHWAITGDLDGTPFPNQRTL